MFYQASWSVLCQPKLNALQYRFALCQVKAALRIRPDQVRYQTALGAAEYRMAHYTESRTTLTRIDPLTPVGLVFLALTQCRLGQQEQARRTLDRLREVSAKREGKKDEKVESLLCELQSLLTCPTN